MVQGVLERTRDDDMKARLFRPGDVLFPSTHAAEHEQAQGSSNYAQYEQEL
jgi:hypothetical protein